MGRTLCLIGIAQGLVLASSWPSHSGLRPWLIPGTQTGRYCHPSTLWPYVYLVTTVPLIGFPSLLHHPLTPLPHPPSLATLSLTPLSQPHTPSFHPSTPWPRPPSPLPDPLYVALLFHFFSHTLVLGITLLLLCPLSFYYSFPSPSNLLHLFAPRYYSQLLCPNLLRLSLPS